MSSLKWCPACSNMLYAIDEESVNGEKTAVMSCRKCTYREAVSAEHPLVYEHILREDKTARLSMNKYYKYAPELPHLDNIQCPNSECPSRGKGVKSDVVAVKISEKNLVWYYQCVHCDTAWKQSSGIKA